MKMFRKDEGFTLIELMVVVLIIGILVAIAIPVFNSAKANSQRKSCFANERTVEGASHSYEASVGVLPGADDTIATLWSDLGVGAAQDSYLAAEPKCPAQATYEWDHTAATLTCVDNGSITGHGHF